MAGDWPDCPHCGREYRYDMMSPEGIPPCCGEPFCRAREYWTDDQWRGRARMAAAAASAGYSIETRQVPGARAEEDDRWVAQRVAYVPSNWDIEALRRYPQDHPHHTTQGEHG